MRGIPIISLFAALIYVVFSGCGEDGSSPTGPGGGGDASATIEGYCLPIMTANSTIAYSTPMRISGTACDTTVERHRFHNEVGFFYHDVQGFQLTGVPLDSYTFTPDYSEWSEDTLQQFVLLPASRTVAIGPGNNRVDPFFLFSREDSTRFADEGLCSIGGIIDYETVIVDTTYQGYSGVLWIKSPDGTIVNSPAVNGIWYRTYVDLPQGEYTIIPEHSLYTFDPQSRTVQVDDIFAVANFTARYSVGEPHTIRGRVLMDEGATSIIRIYPDPRDRMHIHEVQVDGDGSFITPPLLPTTYELEFILSGKKMRNTQSVTITDSDIDMGDIELEYYGSLYYHVTGNAVDASGSGVSGVNISLDGRRLYGMPTTTWPVTTDASGAYRFGGADGFETEESLSLTITPEKSGWVFFPLSAEVAHTYVEHDEYIDLIAPDFIGTPVEIASHFPLDTGASWTYTRSVDGATFGTVTVDAGVPFDAGGQSYIPLSGSMFNGWQGFRVDVAKIYAWNGTESKIYATLDETSWDMGKVGGYTATGTRLASEDVTVPAGTFIGCEVIEIAVIFGETTSETTTLWLAESVGPVKMEFTTMSRGALIGRITDELTAYSLP